MTKAPVKKKTVSKTKVATKRRRAHNSDGSFKADDLSTPDVNEAFVQEKAPMPEQGQRVAQRSVGLRRLGGKLLG
jgi:hypothetical protein|tara:strand:- start:202 stop:426 length:225 start_codon:yes stop_codon:yes gene_type:complete